MTATTGSPQAPTTAAERIAGYGATAALLSGLVAALGTVFLLATFATQASTMAEPAPQLTPLDRVANGLIGLAMLVAIPIAFRLHQSWRTQAFGASAIALVLGVASLAGYGLLLMVLVTGLGSRPADVGGASVVPFGGIGIWLVLVCGGPADAALVGRLRWLGVAIGIGLVVLPIGFFFGGGAAAAANPKLAFGSPLLVATALLSLVAAQIAYPIWAIWLGRRWQAEGARGYGSGAP